MKQSHRVTGVEGFGLIPVGFPLGASCSGFWGCVSWGLGFPSLGWYSSFGPYLLPDSSKFGSLLRLFFWFPGVMSPSVVVLCG